MKGLQFLLLFVFASVVIAEATAWKEDKDHYKKPHYRTAKKFEHHHHKLPKHLHHDRMGGHHGNHEDLHTSHRENEEAKKHAKAAFHHAPYFVSHQEARLQSDLSAPKKSPRGHFLDDSQDMHLQDLTFQSPGHRSPHHYQRGHHKVSHHPFTNHREDRVKTHHRDGHHKMMSDFQEEEKRDAARHHEPFHHTLPVLPSSHHATVSDGRHHSSLRKTEHGRVIPKKAFDKGKKATTKKDSKKRSKAKKHYEW